MSRIDDVARWGREWQKSGAWSPHTDSGERAQALACGYVKYLRLMCNYEPVAGTTKGLDIGAGAGYVAAALASQYKIAMTASEWNEDGIALIHRENPQLPTRVIDIMRFDDRGLWDFILCRELYPFTRVNAFSDQCDLVSRIIDALAPGGIFLLIGSTRSFPHCADYDFLVRIFRKDPRVKRVVAPYLEAIMLRIHRYPFLGRIGYWLANLLGELVFLVMMRRGWAAIRVIVFQKRHEGGARA